MLIGWYCGDTMAGNFISVSQKRQSARGHSNNIKQDAYFGLTGFPRVSSSVSAGAVESNDGEAHATVLLHLRI
jgi:hypothetical protein